MQRVPSIDGWRSFLAPRFRTFHYLALCQGIVAVLAGFDVVIPFALAIGCPPFLAVMLGVLPLAGGVAPIFVPRLLDRAAGNLRGLTIVFAAINETRGVLYVLLVVIASIGMIAGPAAVVPLALVLGVTSFVGAMSTANLLVWYSAVLPETERRLVVPRLMAVSMAVGAALLLPMAAAMDGLADRLGLLAYAIPFGVAGIFGLAELVVLRRLPHPGRVIVPPRAQAAEAEPTPELDHFQRVSVINAAGMGLAPSMSVFAIAVVGLSTGFAMMVGAIATLTMVAGAAFAGSRLAHGSSHVMLRRSFAIRALAMACPILALPGTPTAPLLLIAAAMLGSIGFSSGSIAANERLFRLINGPAVIRHQGRYLARTSGVMTLGQLGGAGVVAVGGPYGYPAFALLYGVSSALRVVAFRQAATRIPRQAPAAAEAGAASLA